MFNIWKHNRNGFGLDITDTSVKAMQLQKSGSNWKILGYLDHALAKGIRANDVVLNEGSMINNIANILRHADYGKIKGSYVVASIPESKAFVRVLQIPKMTEQQAASAVPVEAEQYIPIPIDQAYLDWQIIGERDGKLDILVTASVREYIDGYLKVLKAAGLRPVAFEVESAACVRSLISPQQTGKSVLILHIDSYRTSLIVVENGQMQFTSSIPIAGDAFTQSIARMLGVSVEEAEKIKRTSGFDDSVTNKSIAVALGQTVDGIISELRNMIRFHDEHSSQPLSQIILCGGSAKLPHLGKYMYSKLTDMSAMEIVLGNPWINLFDASRKAAGLPSPADSLGYPTAIGLAIRAASLIDI